MTLLDRKAEKIRALMRSMGSVAVAFSGGTDSALVAKIAVDELGPKAVAVTIDSPLYPSSELKAAKRLARAIGIEHVVIESDLLRDKRFLGNPVDRCYICKSAALAHVRKLADSRGLEEVVEGTNADDRHDYRPGAKAKDELGVRSPLAEAGLTKQDVRKLSRALGLPTADKSASACLASRIPYGERIDEEKLTAIERAEAFLESEGFKEVRVRAHWPVARIEVRPGDIARISSGKMRARVTRRLRALGFTYVTVDLTGYRTGSMDEVLTH
jgi:uncharacterized protein